MSEVSNSLLELQWARVAWSLFLAGFGSSAAQSTVHRGVAAGGESEAGEVPIEVWDRGILLGLGFVRGRSGEETDAAWSEAVGVAAHLSSRLEGPHRGSVVLVPRLRARAPSLSELTACVSSEAGRVRFVPAREVPVSAASGWPPAPGERLAVTVPCAGAPGRSPSDRATAVFALPRGEVLLTGSCATTWAAQIGGDGCACLTATDAQTVTSGFSSRAVVRRSSRLALDEVEPLVGFGAYAGWYAALLVGADGVLGLRAWRDDDETMSS